MSEIIEQQADTGEAVVSQEEKAIDDAAAKKANAAPTGIDKIKAAASGKSPSSAREGTAGSPAPSTIYSPNYKYKAFDQEHELEEMWRPLIKDQESEKKVKDLFTRAHAFDGMKARNESFIQEYQQLADQHNVLDRDVKRVMKYRNEGNLESFFQSFQISDAKIFEYAKKKLALMENPEQAAAYQQQRAEQDRMSQIEEQNQTLQAQYENQAVQARTMQLDMTLARPDVAKIASFCDESAGRIGAFRDLVIKEAKNIYNETGHDLSPEQAINVLLEQPYGKWLKGALTQTAEPQVVQPIQVSSKPVIPTASGKGTSPIKKVPKSLDDLRAMGRELARAGG